MHPIRVSDLAGVTERLLQQTCEELDTEFEDLNVICESNVKQQSHAQKAANKAKNRYANILPCKNKLIASLHFKFS